MGRMKHELCQGNGRLPSLQFTEQEGKSAAVRRRQHVRSQREAWAAPLNYAGLWAGPGPRQHPTATAHLVLLCYKKPSKPICIYISDYKLYPAIFSFSLALFTPQDPKPTKIHFGRKEEEQPEDSCFPLLLLHFQTARSLFSSLSIAHVFQKAAVQTLVTAPIVDS